MTETPTPCQIEQISGKAILRTFVLCRPGSDETEAYALTRNSQAAGNEILASGYPVILLSPDSPMGSALSACRLGDSLSVETPSGVWQAQVIACDGSPTLSADERQQARARQTEEIRRREEQKSHERADRLRRLGEEETVRLLRERRKEQEAHQRANESLRRTAWEARRNPVK